MKNQIYPLTNSETSINRIIKLLKIWPIKCPVCGRLSFIRNINIQNLRESCNCHHCNSTNRQRQIAYLLCQTIGISSLNQIQRFKGCIYNTESSGPIHDQLLKAKHYTFSEYFGDKYKSGQRIKGVINQDLMHLSFKNKIFDIVISSDVFEHMSDPYKAHQEVSRVLKKSGSHIFTVPFYGNTYMDETRSIIKQGKLVHKLPPIYHLDGIRPEDGILVYNIFSLEMLIKLQQIGFDTFFYNINKPSLGIFGPPMVIFKATKRN